MPRTNLSAGEEADAKGKYELDQTLREFGKSSIALCDVMDQGRSLTDIDVLFLENHFQVVQMAYVLWKRKYRPASLDPM